MIIPAKGAAGGTCASVLAAVLLFGCKSPPAPRASAGPAPPPAAADPFAPDESTREMASLLESTAQSTNPGELIAGMNERRVAALRKMLEKETEPEKRERLRSSYAIELLHAGHPEQALEQFAKVEAWMRSNEPHQWQASEYMHRFWEATAWMRLGEDQNCCS